MKYIISIAISLLVFIPSFFLLGRANKCPYESIDDRAWVWRVEKRAAHFLAEDKEDDKNHRVLMDWGNGSRSWVNGEKLPNYYKIHCIDTDARALISADRVNDFIVGKSMDEIEKTLAYATEYKGNTVSFPVKVLTRGEALSSDCIKVTFKDSIATAVDYTQTVDESALLYSYVPGMFLFINKGIRAPQNGLYSSKMPPPEAAGKKYHFGDLTVKLVSFLLKLAFVLLVVLLLVTAPLLLILPLAILAMDICRDEWVGILIGVVLELLVLILYAGVFLVYVKLALWPILIVAAICAILTALFYKYEIYDY